MPYPRSSLPNIVLLLLWLLTVVTGLPLLVAATNLFYFRAIDTSKGTFPGDPDIGVGLLYLAVLANVPALFCWIVYGGWRYQSARKR